MRVVPLLCATVIAAQVTSVAAEPRRTLEAVTLRKKPGEKEAAVATLAANTPVKVISLEGRWLLVKVGNQTGYLTRTTVSEPEPSDGERDARWSQARAVDGALVAELFVEVVAPSAQLRQAPREDAAPLAPAARGARLAVLDAAQAPGWFRARDASGREGWIARGDVDSGAARVAATAGPRDAARGTSQGAGSPTATLVAPAIRAELGVGLRALGMTLASNADGGLTNYVVDAEAVAATLGVDVVHRLGGALFVAVDGRASTSAGSPGIDYPGPTAPAGKIPFRTLAADLGARVGVRARRTFDLALVVGGHYDVFLPTAVKNAGMLPRERLAGLTIGARVDVAPERSSFSATARLDGLVLGERAQTSGLEDGASSAARGLWGGLTMRYALGAHLAAFAGYELGRATTEWTGPSVRQPGVTSARRVDTTQLLQLGISAAL